MSKRARSAWYQLHDCEPALGIVRCPAGDVDEFRRLAAELLRYLAEDPEQYPIGEPVWRWYRHNPCADGEYGWLLGRQRGPGPGNWAGAFVVAAGADAEHLELLERLSGVEAISDGR